MQNGHSQHHRPPHSQPYRQHRARSGHHRRDGFTFIELLIVMAVISLLALFGLSSFRKVLLQYKIEGPATNISNSMQRARAEAIRRGQPVVIELLPADQALRFFVDVDSDLSCCDPLTSPPELEIFPLFTLTEPGSGDNGVYFWSSTEAKPVFLPGSAGLVEGTTEATLPDGTVNVLPAPVLVFEPDGSVRDAGAVRIGTGPHDAAPAVDNYDHQLYEIRVTSETSGRTELRKFIATPGAVATTADAQSYLPEISCEQVDVKAGCPTTGGVNWWKF